MSFTEIYRRVVFVGTDVSEERIAPIFRVKAINELNTLAIAKDCSKLRRTNHYMKKGISVEIPSVAYTESARVHSWDF
jgi:hypothetical protein